MFSAFKRLAGKGDGQQGVSGMPPGHQTMSTQLQRKFARGIQYNMKVIIKGDRNVGKTCLFHRLQGKKFIEEYIPTEEIQVTSIQWNYKATDDIVKVEVWDVVDRGKKKKRFDGLKLDNAQLEIAEEPALDAEFLDVYKGTNGVILMMDITKSWTFDYVQKELPKIPTHIPVIVLANHCDMAHHRTVTQTQIQFFIESMQNRATQVRYTESSMRNGFGLKLLHKFFNLPFLQLQRVSLLQQLERNKTEMNLTCQELDMYFESDEANYEKFIDQLANRRRQVAELNSPRSAQTMIPSTTSIDNSQSGNNSYSSMGSQPGEMKTQLIPIVIGAGHPIPVSGLKNNTTLDIDKLSQASKIANMTNSSQFSNKINTSIPRSPSGDSKSEQSFMSKIFGNKQQTTKDSDPSNSGLDVSKITADFNTIVSVDEFCPDGGQLDKSFLEDVEKNDAAVDKNVEAISGSDSDDETDNPLVAGVQDDVLPEDYHATATNYNSFTNNSNVDFSSSKTDKLHDTNSKLSTLDNDNAETNLSAYMTSASNHNDYDNDYSASSSNNNYYTSVPNSDTMDSWLSTDLKWRRSPDGGEDVSTTAQSLDYSGSNLTNDDTGSIKSFSATLLDSSKSSSSRNKTDSTEKSHSKKESKKYYKDEEKHKSKKKEHKESKSKKSSHSSKSKESKHSSKKKRSRDETCDRQQEHNKRDELEEFLNGAAYIEDHAIDAAYEAF